MGRSLRLNQNFKGKKIFKIDIFVLKHVLDHSKSIPTKKNFRNFFWLFGLKFFEKTAMSQKKIFQGEKIFKLEIFILKYVLNHSESIPTKKIFENFPFFGHFGGKKSRFFAIFQFFKATRKKV